MYTNHKSFENAINEEKGLKSDLEKMADQIDKLFHISQNAELSASLKALADEAKRISEKFDELGRETFSKINHSRLVYDFNEHKLIKIDDSEEDEDEDDPSVCDRCCDCEEECCDDCGKDPRYHDVDFSKLYPDETPVKDDEDDYYESLEDETSSNTTMISFHNCNFIFGDPYQIETFIKSLKSNKEPGDI